MTLSELKKEVTAACEKAEEYGVCPGDITVTLQIDLPGNEESIWSSDDVELHYDNDGAASGCVLLAVKEEDI